MKQKHFDLLQSTSRIGTWEVDLATKTVTWDKIVKEIHEVPQDFVPDLETGINFYKEGYSRDKINEVVGKCFETGEAYDVELQIVTHNKTDKWVRAIGHAEFDKEGNPICMYGTFEDIQKYKEDIQTIKTQEAVIHSAGIGIWNWNPQNNEVSFSDGWKEMLGYEPHEISNSLEEWSSRVHPDDIEGCFADINLHMEGKIEIYTNEHRMKHKDGHWVWILDQGKIIEKNEEGLPIKFVGTHLDVTARIENQNIIKKFFSLAPDFMAIANTEGYFEVINKSFTRELGYSEEELTNQPFINFVHPEDVENTVKEVQSLGDGSNAIKFQNRYRKKNGSYIWFEWNAQLDTETGKLFAAARDITKEKSLTQNLEESNERLEEFASIASHDLKAPIRKIGLLCDFIEDDCELNEEGIEYFNTIKKTTNSMNSLVTDLLHFSKVRNIALSKVNFDVKDILKEIADEIIDSNHEFHVFETPLNINADKTRFKEAIANLIGNAYKYNQSDRKIVEIAFDDSTKNLRITDNGIGISQSNFSKIFEPFKRLHAQSEYEGTGAGLAIVKRILDRHNISIKIESEEGKGTSFILDLGKVIA